MGKIEKGFDQELHTAEVKGRKVQAKNRVGDYYLQVDNDSKQGVRYKNTIPKHRFGKLLVHQPFLDFSLFSLVKKALAKLKSNKSK